MDSKARMKGRRTGLLPLCGRPSRCWPSAGVALGLTLLWVRPRSEGRLSDSRWVLVEFGTATPKGAGLTGNYSPAVWSGTAAVGTFESKRFC